MSKMKLGQQFHKLTSSPGVTRSGSTLDWPDCCSCLHRSAIGLLAVWSRQTATAGHPGPGIGLILGWITMMLLAFHWARVVWTRTAVQLAAEAERRQDAADREPGSLLDGPEDL